jgi:hypothetical protein
MELQLDGNISALSVQAIDFQSRFFSAKKAAITLTWNSLCRVSNRYKFDFSLQSFLKLQVLQKQVDKFS